MEKLAVAGRPVLHAHYHQAQRVVPDLHDGIHRDFRPRFHVAGEIGFAERQPRRACRKVIGEEVGLSGQGRRDREATIADHLGGDPLADLRLGERIERQGEVGVGMNVDKTGSEDSSGSVDLACRCFAPPRLDGRYSPITDGHIDGSWCTSGAVDDSGAADQQVVHASPPRPIIVLNAFSLSCPWSRSEQEFYWYSSTFWHPEAA